MIMFKTKNFIIWELAIAALYGLFNILFTLRFLEWVNNFCQTPDCPPGMNCQATSCIGVIHILVNWFLGLIFLLYLFSFIIYKIVKYFNKDKPVQLPK